MKLNILLALVLLGTIGANLGVDRDPAVPARDYFPEMVYSRAAESYAADPALGSGQTLQLPPDGTIPRGASLVRYQPTPADALRAGAELAAPHATQADLARGAVVFRNFCTPCHGAGGTGDGIVVTRGFPPPPSLLAQHARDMQAGQMFHVLTYGQVNMPSYASQLDEADRWRVIAHVRQLQGSARP